MRILAIRGANIASLAGEFALEMDRGPLASAGLFAIVGPTGAGKSSLLDALCAALYNRTPRLDGRSQVRIGRDDEPAELHLSPFDPRSLLRRGAASGRAEVDFEGRDGRRWRAEWRVRRARGRASGRLQEVEQSLVCLDTGERRGGTRHETLTAIEDALGLSFDQFRRSALLAQGEFAAFLRADAAQRAELLERVTGTEIYGALSIAAHRRAQEAQAELDVLRAELARIAVLDDDARATLGASAAEAGARAADAEAEAGALETARAWQVEDDALGARLAEAEARATVARTAATSVLDARAALARIEAAEALREPWRERARAGDAETSAAAAATAARGDAEAASARHAAANQVAARAGEARAAARAREVAIAPELAKARRLDDEAVAAVIEARTAADAAAVAAAEAAAARARWSALAAGEGGRRDAVEAAAERLARAEGAVAEAKEAHQDAEHRWRAAEQRALELPLPPAEAALAREQEQRLRQKDLERAHADAARTSAAADEHARAAELARALVKSANAHAKKDARARAIVRARLDEAEAARDRLRIALGLAEQRAALVAGEACPLCGATEHPWGHGEVAMLGADADARIGELRVALESHDLAIAGARAEADAGEREAERRDRDAAAAQVELEDARARWRDGVAALGELLLAEDPADAGDWLATRLAASEAAHAAAHKQVEAARRRATEVRKLADVVRARSHDLEHAEETRRGAEDTRRGAEQALAVLQLQIAEARAPIAAADADAARARADAAAAADALDAVRVARAALLGGRASDDVAAEHAAATAAAEAADDAARVTAAAAAAAVAGASATAAAAATAATTAAGAGAAAAAALAHALAAAHLDESAAAALLAHDRAWVAAERERLDALDRAVAEAETVVAERRARQVDHRALQPDGAQAPAAALADRRDEARARASAAATAQRTAAAALAADDDARARRGARERELGTRAGELEVHRELSELIGSHDGKKLRTFAQSLSLDALLDAANHHLLELQPRYLLERVRGHDLELQVVDREMGDEVRSVHSLSGGESFLVSLALALALSSLSARDVRVRTLLIDEGFGTLDPATLDVALDVLDALQSAGRQVGIISHVPGLAERVPAQVLVEPRGGGKSTVTVRAAG